MKANSLLLRIAAYSFLICSCSSIANSTIVNVLVSSNTFNPPTFNIGVGDTVRWNWASGFHTTTCDGSPFTGRPFGADGWNADMNMSSPTFTYVVRVAGSYGYKCNFHAPSMTGTFTAFTSFKTLYLTAVIEGFLNGPSMTEDTVRVSLHSPASPYNQLDSAKVKLSHEGKGLLIFPNNAAGSNFYIVVNHRNSIRTWSKMTQMISVGSTAIYNFTSAATQAYGDNLKLKNGRWTIYSGDPNKDGAVELSDIIIVFNDANAFVSGYVSSDINGDGFTDLSDLVITFNNSNNFVGEIRP